MKNFVLFASIMTLVSCGTLKEAGKVLRNEKVNTTDEFLVKKKEPLILPPDYKEIPKPNSKNNQKEDSDEKIKKIISAPKEEKKNKSKGSSSTENSILKKIRQ